ncbi:MAG: ComEC/Rec2 family competence protein [Chloroherpetonaceae bacterium]
MAYPSLYALATIAVGIYIGARLPACLNQLLLLAFALLILTLLLHALATLKKNKTLRAFELITVLFLIAAAFCAYSNFKTKYISQTDIVHFANQTVWLKGTLASKVSAKNRSAQWTLNAQELVRNSDTTVVSGKVRVRLYSDLKTDLKLGDEIWISGKLKLPQKAMNAGEFNYRNFLDEQGIFTLLAVQHDSLIQKTGNINLSFYERYITLPTAERLSKTIQTLIPKSDEQQFVKGLILGERSDLSDEIKLAFQRTGTIHVLVISGLHIGLLVLLLDLVFKRLKTTRSGKWIAFGLAAVLLFFYSNITGNSPPVVRAVIMALVFGFSKVIERKAYPLNTLAFCLIVIFTLDPRALFSASVHLTTGAVASILLVYPRLSEWIAFETETKWLKPIVALAKYVWESLALTLSASIGVSPLIAYYFGSTAFLGILANLPVVLLTSLAVYAAIPMILFDLVWQTLATPYAVSVYYFVHWAIFFAKWFSELPIVAVAIQPTIPVLMAFYLSVLALLQLRNPKTRAKWIIAALVAINVAVWLPIFEPKSPTPKFIFNAVYGGTSIFVNAGGETLLIDAGAKRSDWARIEEQLQTFGLMPTAFVQFSSSDSVVQDVPIKTKASRVESMKTSGAIVIRPSVEHCKILTKQATMVCTQYLKDVSESEFFKSDVIFLKLLRFREQEKAALEKWIQQAEPKLVVVELLPFVRRVERKFFYRFAKTQPLIKTTERDGQIVWKE